MVRPKPCVLFAQSFLHSNLAEYVDEVSFSPSLSLSLSPCFLHDLRTMVTLLFFSSLRFIREDLVTPCVYLPNFYFSCLDVKLLYIYIYRRRKNICERKATFFSAFSDLTFPGFATGALHWTSSDLLLWILGVTVIFPLPHTLSFRVSKYLIFLGSFSFLCLLNSNIWNRW